MDEYAFQDLCRDLLDAQAEIATSSIYGERGECQDGIDVLAQRKAGDGIEVGQCKRYQKFPPADIQKASNEFFAYWPRWSQEQVKRFVLFVACDMNSRQQRDMILQEKKRFAEQGIIYEVWDAAELRNKLRPHPGIVTTYFRDRPEYWVEVICGITLPTYQMPAQTSRSGSNMAWAVLGSQLDGAATLISSDTEQRLNEMRSQWHGGRKREPKIWLTDLKHDAERWNFLTPELKAKLLCSEAGWVLDETGDVQQARQLADEAHTYASSATEIRLRAIITYVEQGPEAALDLLPTPTDVDSINVKAALLFELGRLDECQALLATDQAGLTPNAETFRLQALTFLLQREVSQAQLAIHKALELEPTWERILYAAGIIDYFSTLAPVAIPRLLESRPRPVDWFLIRSDAESISRLRQADERFRLLVANPEASSIERTQLQAWRLACLANDPERQTEAVGFCQELLQIDPTNSHALTWAVARSYNLDFSRSETQLNRLVNAKKAEPHHILALFNRYLVSGRAKKALNLLDRTRAVFERDHADAVWVVSRAEVLSLRGDIQGAMTTINTTPTQVDLRHVQTVALQAQATKTGDWHEFLDHIERSYADTGDIQFILDACQFMAQRQQWQYVVDHADVLFAALPTPPVVGMVALSLFNTRAYERCLTVLDSHRWVFHQEKLPGHLRRLRAVCQHNLGIFPSALAEAESLAREEPTPANLLTLAQLYIQNGNFAGIAIIARQLLGRSDITAQQYLQLADLVRLDDHQLAVDLWRHATRHTISDELVGPAFGLGVQLGLDAEVHDRLPPIHQLADENRGGMRSFTLEEFLAFNRERQEHWAEFEAEYANSTLPIHALAEFQNVSLAELYHHRAVIYESAPDPLRHGSLLIRHGSRSLSLNLEPHESPWQLYMDITAILLAAHLEILSLVEQTLRPLHIPAEVIPALIHMRDQFTPHQPSVIRSYEQVVDAADRKRMRVVNPPVPIEEEYRPVIQELGESWVALLAYARNVGGYLVDFLPLRKRDLSGPPTTLSTEMSQLIVNCRTLVDALQQHGAISHSDHAQAIQKLGQEGHSSVSDAVPVPGSLLVCDYGVLELLARANVLDTLCEWFTVAIHADELKQRRAGITESARRRTTVDWLTELIRRLGAGIEQGVYVGLPDRGDNVLADEDAPDTPAARSLLALLHRQGQPGEVVWIDDRMAQRNPQIDGTPVVGITEILHQLVQADVVSETAYYQKLSRLRAANMRFLPLHPDELWFHLRQAPVVQGVIRETANLTILRQYFAACLVSGSILRGSIGEDDRGELPFVMSTRRAIIEVLCTLWDTEQDETVCGARARWLLDNLHIDVAQARYVIAQAEGDVDPRYLLALDLSELLLPLGMDSMRLWQEKPDTYQRYVKWLDQEVLVPHCDADSLLLSTISMVVQQHLRLIESVVQQNLPPALVASILQRAYNTLPTAVQDEVAHDTDLMAHMGLQRQITVAINQFQFEATAFWHAASAVVNGATSTITDLHLNHEITLQPATEGHTRAIRFINPVDGTEQVVADGDLGLLDASVSAREAILRDQREWFDYPDTLFERKVADIIAIEDPSQRIEAVRNWRNASAVIYYETLKQRFQSGQLISLDELVLTNLEGLLRSLRLPADTGADSDFEAALTTAAGVLIHENGIRMAFVRLAGLPVTLPSIFVDAFRALPPVEQRQIIKRMLKGRGSPLAALHGIRVLLDVGHEHRSYKRLAHRLAMWLLSPAALDHWEILLTILRWVNAILFTSSADQAYTPQIRLALVWTHAHHLMHILMSAGTTRERVQQAFDLGTSRIPVKILDRNQMYWFDSAHPQRVDRVSLLLTGLAASFATTATEEMSQELRDRCINVAFSEIDGGLMPVLALLVDSGQTYNALGSFLGGDRGDRLRGLLGDEAADVLHHSTLRGLVDNALDQITATSNLLAAWSMLYIVCSDVPLEEDVRIRLAEIVQQTDFVRLFEEDATLGITALQVATLQAGNFDTPSVVSYLKDQLVKVVTYLADQSLDELVREGTLDLVQPVLCLCLTAPTPVDVCNEFNVLVTQLINPWPALIRVYRPIVQRFYQELPAAQAYQLRSLLLRLRAEP
jgi:hypothetical protein